MPQVLKSSAFSRKIVNLFAGMAYGSPDLPGVLRAGGYSCHSIEQSFTVESARIVNPEIILCSDADGHTLLVEAKSGANLSADQLGRYALITSECLEKSAFTSAGSAISHDLLVIGLPEWRARLLMGSSQVPCPRRVLAVADVPFPEERGGESLARNSPEIIGGILRIENVFSNERLNSVFSDTLKVDWDVVPHNFLPVDHEAADWEFAGYLIPEIIAAILKGEKVLKLDALARSFIRHWDNIAAKYQMLLLDRMRDILKLASQTRLSRYLVYGVKEAPRDEARLISPEGQQDSQARLRSQLRQRFREFMSDLNSPQIAMIYED